MAKTLEFFFDYASPYSYLACQQVEAVAQRTGAELRWRPFLLGAVFKATGNKTPTQVPQKGVYIAKDLQDWLRYLGLPALVLPESFPINSLKANRLALVAAEHGKVAAFSHAAFRAAFAEGRDLSDPKVLAELAREVGLEPDKALAHIDNQEIKDALRRNTERRWRAGCSAPPPSSWGTTCSSATIG